MSDKDYIFFEPSQKLHKKTGKVYWLSGTPSDYYYVRRGAPIVHAPIGGEKIDGDIMEHPVHNDPYEDLGYKPHFKLHDEGDVWRLEDISGGYYPCNWWVRKEDLFNV